MKANTPKPTRLSEILENYAGQILTYDEMYRKQHHNPERNNADRDYAVKVATQSIQEQLKALLPDKGKIVDFTALDDWEQKQQLEINEHTKTEHRIIDQIVKAIEEWAR